jgi:hypothetical protein
MFIYDVSLAACKLKQKLPATGDWLRPKYDGPGDYESRMQSGTLRDGVNNPTNWRTDFSDYDYTYPENLELKEQLNAAKNRITPIRSDPASDKKFNTVSTACNRYEDLRGRRGILVQRYNAEIVTNAWMKMYECMSLLDEPLLSKIAKVNTRAGTTVSRDFNSFHIAEAPGNFMVAMNHYLFSHYPQIDWTWAANSYRDLYTRSITGDPRLANTFYLTDTYGLIRNYKDRWVFGVDGDGDITSPANIKSFVSEMEKRFPSGLHFITSDVKFVPPDVNYDEEEFQNIPVQMGHMLSSLATLKKGGCMMLKEFSFFEAPKMSHLYLLANCFSKLYVVKPETSRPANSEVYVFGIGYKKNLTELQMDILYDEMRYIRYLTNGSPSIFKQSDIPKAFSDRVHELNVKLVGRQVPAIDRNIALYQQYKDSHYAEICRDVANIRSQSAEAWVKKFGIKDLPRKHHIATFAEHAGRLSNRS